MPAEALATIESPLAAVDPPLGGTRVDEMRLIGKAIAGDRRAAKAIYDEHVAAVFRLACAMVGGERAAEVTQDVLVRVFERLHQFHGDSALRSWIHRITVSIALNARRRDRRDRHVGLDTAGAAVAAVAEVERDPVLLARLHAAIDALPTGMRAVFLFYEVEGYSHAEIATMLEIREGTSKARLSHARSMLRIALADLADCA